MMPVALFRSAGTLDSGPLGTTRAPATRRLRTASLLTRATTRLDSGQGLSAFKRRSRRTPCSPPARATLSTGLHRTAGTSPRTSTFLSSTTTLSAPLLSCACSTDETHHPVLRSQTTMFIAVDPRTNETLPMIPVLSSQTRTW